MDVDARFQSDLFIRREKDAGIHWTGATWAYEPVWTHGGTGNLLPQLDIGPRSFSRIARRGVTILTQEPGSPDVMLKKTVFYPHCIYVFSTIHK